MAYEDFKLRSSGNIPSSDYYKNMLQGKLDSVFNLASDVYTIKKQNRTTGLFEDITVRITPWFGETHDDDVKDDYKRLYFQDLDLKGYLGDIYEFDNYRWMSINREGIKTITKDATIRRCNIQLKFKESSMSDDTITLDGIATRKMQLESDKTNIQLSKGLLNVFIPNNANSKKIRLSPKPTKFLLGNQDPSGKYQCWRVESIDAISFVRRDLDIATEDTGYIVLRLELYQSSPKDDNTNGIAWQDYYA